MIHKSYICNICLEEEGKNSGDSQEFYSYNLEYSNELSLAPSDVYENHICRNCLVAIDRTTIPAEK